MVELHPKTRKLLDLFARAEYGTELSYARILQETDCDLVEGDRQRIYTVIRRLERDHRRTLLNLRGYGYKVADPNEFVKSMRVRTTRAKRHISLARRTGEATPLDRLTDGERQVVADQMAFNAHVWQALKEQSVWNRTTDDRVSRVEAELRELRELRGLAGPVVEGEATEEAA